MVLIALRMLQAMGLNMDQTKSEGTQEAENTSSFPTVSDPRTPYQALALHVQNAVPLEAE